MRNSLNILAICGAIVFAGLMTHGETQTPIRRDLSEYVNSSTEQTYKAILAGQVDILKEVKATRADIAELRTEIKSLSSAKSVPDATAKLSEATEDKTSEAATEPAEDPFGTLCIKLPSGVDADFPEYLNNATGKFIAEGNTTALLISEGFSVEDCGKLTEAERVKLFDAWKSQNSVTPASYVAVSPQSNSVQPVYKAPSSAVARMYVAAEQCTNPRQCRIASRKSRK